MENPNGGIEMHHRMPQQGVKARWISGRDIPRVITVVVTTRDVIDAGIITLLGSAGYILLMASLYVVTFSHVNFGVRITGVGGMLVMFLSYHAALKFWRQFKPEVLPQEAPPGNQVLH